MKIQQDVSLKSYNTFGLDVAAAFFTELTDEQQLLPLTTERQWPAEKRVLGGGSNILLTKPVKGLLVKNSLKGIAVLEENDQHVWLEVKAGEVWHELVLYAIERNLGGLENLALIPGCVGAAPMQNIGAYGVEVRDTIEEVVAWHWEEQAFIRLKKEECRFGYRDSIFKQELKDKVLISSVIFKLNKVPTLNTSYGALQQELDKMGVQSPSVKNIADAVITIRSSKLPDPKHIGNAGSFFKNPAIAPELFERLKAHYPEIPSFPVSETSVKVPAGWLIEQAGWKGYREGDAGVHPKQALVLVNYGKATGLDVYRLSEKILNSILDKFGITLEREVNIW